MYFMVQISCSCKWFFKYFNLPFPSFMTMLICTQWHGSKKHWWHNSVSLQGYLLTSTKRSFLEICLVMIQFIWVSYKTSHHVHIVYICILKLISFMLHVVSCHIVLYIYNTHTLTVISSVFITYLMCIFCKSTLMYQSMCIYNTCITYYVYHLYHISHYVLQLLKFILNTLPTYLNTYLCT